MKDYYRILQVPRNASTSEIREAYRRRARSTHPDALGSEDPSAFLEVQEAWETLGTAKSRHAYDQALARATPVSRRRPRAEPMRPAAQSSDVPSPPFGSLFDQLWSSFWEDDDFGRRGWRTPDFDLVLNRDEAQRGGEVPLSIPIIVRCCSCDGTGRQFVYFCSACAGRGSLRRHTSFRLRIPPGFEGTQLVEIPVTDLPLHQDVITIRVRSA
jgi:molecular chaperone DnaJ